MNSFEDIDDRLDAIAFMVQFVRADKERRRKSLEFHAGAIEHWNRPAGRLGRWLRSLLGLKVQTREEYDQRIDLLAQQQKLMTSRELRGENERISDRQTSSLAR